MVRADAGPGRLPVSEGLGRWRRRVSPTWQAAAVDQGLHFEDGRLGGAAGPGAARLPPLLRGLAIAERVGLGGARRRQAKLPGAAAALLVQLCRQLPPRAALPTPGALSALLYL